MDTRELERQFPEAFAALPECYKADDCLYFWEAKKFNAPVIYACPAAGQQAALGAWEAVFNKRKNRWDTVHSEGMPKKGCVCHV